MSLFLVIQEAKVYREFYVNAKSPTQAKKFVEKSGNGLPHTTQPIKGEEKVVEIWIEEATLPIWQIDPEEDNLHREHQSEEKRIMNTHES